MRVRHGFTLVELVVVILILGILAAIAMPRLLETGAAATDNGLRQALFVVRDAIDRYAAENVGLPGASDGTEATFHSDMEPYLRGRFPTAPLGPAKDDDGVVMTNAGTPLSGDAAPSKGWKYDYTTGEFVFNFSGISSDGVTNYDDF